MDYTPEQLRNSAGYTEALLVKRGLELVTVEAVGHMDQLRAHAAKIEECERYRRALEEIKEDCEILERNTTGLGSNIYKVALAAIKEPK